MAPSASGLISDLQARLEIDAVLRAGTDRGIERYIVAGRPFGSEAEGCPLAHGSRPGQQGLVSKTVAYWPNQRGK